jgi:3-oxoisoapionate decarboxylase
VTRIGISSWAYPWAVGVPGFEPERPMTALDLLDRAAELDVTVVQIADNLPLHTLSGEDLRAVRDAADARGLQLEVGTVGCTPSIFRRYLAIAMELGSPLVRVVLDTAVAQPAPAEVVATMRAVIPAFEEAGVDLLIENHDRFPARELRRIVHAVESDRMGVCLDTVNSLGCLEPVQTVLETLRPMVRNVHLKDFTIQRVENRMGFTVSGAPVGAGALDVPGLLAQVGEMAGDVSVVLEQWPVAEDALTATLRKEEAWAAQSITYLKACVAARER